MAVTYIEALNEELRRCQSELSELKNKYRWHHVVERDPDKTMPVLISCPEDVLRIVIYINGKFTDWQKIYYPEYWIEIPALPLDEESDDE